MNGIIIGIVAPSQFGKTTFISMLCEKPNELLSLSSQKANDTKGRTKCTIAYRFTPTYKGKARLHVEEGDTGIRFRDYPNIDQKLLNDLKKPELGIEIPPPEDKDKDITDIEALKKNIIDWCHSPDSEPLKLMSVSGIYKLISEFIFDIQPNKELSSAITEMYGEDGVLIMVDTKGLFDPSDLKDPDIKNLTNKDIGLAGLHAVIFGCNDVLRIDLEWYHNLLKDLICTIPTFIMWQGGTERKAIYRMLKNIGFASKVDNEYVLNNSYFKKVDFNIPFSDVIDDYNDRNPKLEPVSKTEGDIPELIEASTANIIEMMSSINKFYTMKSWLMSLTPNELFGILTNDRLNVNVPQEPGKMPFTDQFRLVLNISEALKDIPQWNAPSLFTVSTAFYGRCSYWDRIKGSYPLTGIYGGVSNHDGISYVHTHKLMRMSYEFYVNLADQIEFGSLSDDEIINKVFRKAVDHESLQNTLAAVNENKIKNLIIALFRNKTNWLSESMQSVENGRIVASRYTIFERTLAWRNARLHGEIPVNDNENEFLRYLIISYIIKVLSQKTDLSEGK